jgi:hypothetical protein
MRKCYAQNPEASIGVHLGNGPRKNTARLTPQPKMTAAKKLIAANGRDAALRRPRPVGAERMGRERVIIVSFDSVA